MEVPVHIVTGGVEDGGFSGRQSLLSQLKIALCLLFGETAECATIWQKDNTTVVTEFEGDGFPIFNLAALSFGEDRNSGFSQVILVELEAVIDAGDTLE